MATGWTVLDPLLSVLVAGLVIRSAWGLVAESIQVLLQAAPIGLDTAAILADLQALPGVGEAGHLHAWTLTDRSTVATVHVTPAAGADPLALPALVTARLVGRHGLTHATVQVDPPGAIAPTPH
jgi:cobalt-zinc-cadmium efflux system protein